MQKTYTNPVYTYVSHPDLNAKEAVHHPVVIVGDGPGGLALAIDFALHCMASAQWYWMTIILSVWVHGLFALLNVC
jgi:hypothetical protein